MPTEVLKDRLWTAWNPYCSQVCGNRTKTDVGGRDRHRTGDPLLAKHDSRLQPLYPSLQLLTFLTNRGICFPLKAIPNGMKTLDSYTIRAQQQATCRVRT